MWKASVSELARALRSGEFTSEALTACFLERIQALNPVLNAVLHTNSDAALEAAQRADRALKADTTCQHPLLGIPYLLKDIFCTTDAPTTCGSRMLKDYMSPFNATVVERLAAAGAVCLGKTNLDEFAMGSSNEHSAFGSVRNPWNVQHCPGGSSGGSSAAVAARLAPLATGTDTGGSIRQPAAFCGITGLKPTYGRVSRYGMVAFASSLDQGGPMGASAEDCAIMLDALSGHDPKDATSAQRPATSTAPRLSEPRLQGLRVGVLRTCHAEGLDTEIADAIDRWVSELEAAGVHCKTLEIPHIDLGTAAYYVIAPSEASSNLSRYDGVRFGYRAEGNNDLESLYCLSRDQGFGDEVKRRILIGTYALSSDHYDSYYLKAQKIRQLIRSEFEACFQEVDLVLTPTTAQTAFALGDADKNHVTTYLSDRYTLPANLAGLPAISMPIGRASNGLPIGGQLIGQAFDELTLLQVAHQYQQRSRWHQDLPDQIQPTPEPTNG